MPCSKRNAVMLSFPMAQHCICGGSQIRTPHVYDITIPRGKNVTILKRDNPNLRCHYLPRDFYEIGITQTRSPQGAEVRLSDKERCIRVS